MRKRNKKKTKRRRKRIRGNRGGCRSKRGGRNKEKEEIEKEEEQQEVEEKEEHDHWTAATCDKTYRSVHGVYNWWTAGAPVTRVLWLFICID